MANPKSPRPDTKQVRTTMLDSAWLEPGHEDVTVQQRVDIPADALKSRVDEDGPRSDQSAPPRELPPYALTPNAAPIETASGEPELFPADAETKPVAYVHHSRAFPGGEPPSSERPASQPSGVRTARREEIDVILGKVEPREVSPPDAAEADASHGLDDAPSRDSRTSHASLPDYTRPVAISDVPTAEVGVSYEGDGTDVMSPSSFPDAPRSAAVDSRSDTDRAGPLSQSPSAHAPSAPRVPATEVGPGSFAAFDDGGLAQRDVEGQLPASTAQALTQPVRVRSVVVPAWVLVAIFAVAVGLTGVLLGALTTSAAEPEEVLEATASSPVAAANSASTPDLAERAEAGELNAINELSARAPDRLSVREASAIHQGRGVQRRRELDAFAKRLRQDPESLSKSETVERLRTFVEDPETAARALRVLAELPSARTADILYEVWTGTRERTETTELARALLYTNEVRPAASEALAVALDLRAAESCEDNARVLPRAVQHADRRSLHLLGKLMAKRGCGPQKNEDCWACLRNTGDLKAAIGVARQRSAPKF